MKTILYIFASFLLVGFANAQENGTSNIKFEKLEHDFGSQPQGKPVTYEFKFTNVGKTAIELENVKASCGCTTPIWTKDPVAPGETGVVKAQYNMARSGSFRKSITVTTKDGENIVLYISGNAVEQTNGVEESEPKFLTDPNK
ncbi:MAG: DUF1573 domain-containing protein [Chitinophagales bacterium]|nr:DUF1573 domain-containing protein [Chitinophagales bacterium]